MHGRVVCHRYLHRITDLRTAVACVAHAISIPVGLHGVWHFRTVIQHILDSCKTPTDITRRTR